MNLEEIKKRFREKFQVKGPGISVSDTVFDFFTAEFTELTKSIIGEDIKTPHQVESFMSGCPSCGAEANRSFVEDKCKEIVKDTKQQTREAFKKAGIIINH